MQQQMIQQQMQQQQQQYQQQQQFQKIPPMTMGEQKNSSFINTIKEKYINQIILQTDLTNRLLADIDNKINAILYDSNEIDGLKKALIYFEGLSDQDRLNMSAAGIKKYNEIYTEKAHMDKIVEIYFN
jgi:hypothetical protein